MSTMDGDAIQPFHPLSSPSPPALNLSQHQGLSNESALCIRWPKHWSFSFSISPSNEYSRLISFGIVWFELLAVQETLKSLFQHQNLKALILRHSIFFMVQLSHSYTTTGKTIALTILTFVSKVISLPLNMLSRFVITFLPRSKYLLISWLPSSSAVILEPKKRKLSLLHFFPFYLPWNEGTRCHDLSFLDFELNTGVGCHFLLQGISWPRDWTLVSYVSCLGKWILYHWATREDHYFNSNPIQ